MADNNSLNMILSTDMFILQRMSLDGAPHMKFSAKDLERFIGEVYIKQESDLTSRVAGLEYTSATHTEQINTLTAEISDINENNDINLKEVNRHLAVHDVDIERLQSTVTEYLNQSRNFGTFQYNSDENPPPKGYVWFNDTNFGNVTSIKFSKTDYYDIRFSYDNIMVGEVLEFRAYRETGDIDDADISPLARVVYTINAVTGRDANPNGIVTFTVTVQYAIGQLEDDMVLVTELFPNFDPNLKADQKYVDDELAKLEKTIDENHKFTEENVMPVGSIIAWFATQPPKGWYMCNGSSFSGSQNPVLSALLGSNSTPNLKGRYLVMGGDDGLPTVRNQVPQSTALPTAGFTTSSAGAHTHFIGTAGWSPSGTKTDNDTFRAKSGGASSKYTNEEGGHTHTIGGGDTYTRPRSVVVNYIIKGG